MQGFSYSKPDLKHIQDTPPPPHPDISRTSCSIDGRSDLRFHRSFGEPLVRDYGLGTCTSTTCSVARTQPDQSGDQWGKRIMFPALIPAHIDGCTVATPSHDHRIPVMLAGLCLTQEAPKACHYILCSLCLSKNVYIYHMYICNSACVVQYYFTGCSRLLRVFPRGEKLSQVSRLCKYDIC